MSEGVCAFKDITLVFENSVSAAPLLIYTDMPGGVMGLERTISIPVTTARKELTWPLDIGGALLFGKLIQYKATPSGVLILYSGFVRFRRIGEYIDGTQGDIWETQPITLSP